MDVLKYIIWMLFLKMETENILIWITLRFKHALDKWPKKIYVFKNNVF